MIFSAEDLRILQMEDLTQEYVEFVGFDAVPRATLVTRGAITIARNASVSGGLNLSLTFYGWDFALFSSCQPYTRPVYSLSWTLYKRQVP